MKRSSSRRSLWPALLLLDVGALTAVAQTPAGNPPARRDPFWPLGYTPAVQEQAPPENPSEPVKPKETVTPEADVSLTGVTAQHWEAAESGVGIRPPRYSLGGRGGDENLVLIDGKIKSKGELVFHEKNGVRFSWLVANISREKVTFERRTAEILPKPGASADGKR